MTHVEMFLMYRVELKEGLSLCFTNLLMAVPNVPCGVERCLSITKKISLLSVVPNVPCGVES